MGLVCCFENSLQLYFLVEKWDAVFISEKNLILESLIFIILEPKVANVFEWGQ